MLQKRCQELGKITADPGAMQILLEGPDWALFSP